MTYAYVIHNTYSYAVVTKGAGISSYKETQ